MLVSFHYEQQKTGDIQMARGNPECIQYGTGEAAWQAARRAVPDSLEGLLDDDESGEGYTVGRQMLTSG